MPEEQKAPNHPVKDIVLPLITVIALLSNALLIGVAWGRFSYRMEVSERNIQLEHEANKEQNREIQGLKDRAHDLERDMKENERRFLHLDDYTRGRIDKLPYKAPPPARW